MRVIVGMPFTLGIVNKFYELAGGGLQWILASLIIASSNANQRLYERGIFCVTLFFIIPVWNTALKLLLLDLPFTVFIYYLHKKILDLFISLVSWIFMAALKIFMIFESFRDDFILNKSNMAKLIDFILI